MNGNSVFITFELKIIWIALLIHCHQRQLFSTPREKHSRKVLNSWGTNGILKQKRRVGIVCMISDQVAILIFCTIWQPNCYRNSGRDLYQLKRFFGRDSQLMKNRIISPYCFLQIILLWPKTRGFYSSSISYGLFCIQQKIHLVLFPPFLLNKFYPGAYSHSHSSVGLEDKRLAHLVEQHYCYVIWIGEDIPY